MNPITPPPYFAPFSFPLGPEWVMFFEGVFRALQPQGGTTAQRPTEPALYQPYFDTTIGKPIWCAQVTPSIEWVDATGTSV